MTLLLLVVAILSERQNGNNKHYSLSLSLSLSRESGEQQPARSDVLELSGGGKKSLAVMVLAVRLANILSSCLTSG
jgi:hypothetical protein